ncbi:MAG: hypothetical protein ACYSUT_05105 [Planctomycetota bacterium]|jgi:hypothetical protein
MTKAFEKTRYILFSVAALLMLAGITPAAVTLQFIGVSDNNLANVPVGEDQFSVTVSDNGGGEVLFLFDNAGPKPSTISNIYYDIGGSLSLSFVDFVYYPSQEVLYQEGASPADMKEAPSFETDLAYSPNGNISKGIDPGEQLGILFDASYGDVADALYADELQIGIHAQRINAGQGESSEWYVTGTPIIPAPASVALAAIGMGLIRGLRKRKTL